MLGARPAIGWLSSTTDALYSMTPSSRAFSVLFPFPQELNKNSETANATDIMMVIDFKGGRLKKSKDKHLVQSCKLIAQNFQHRLKALFLRKKLGGELAIFVAVNEHMFGCRHQAMLGSAIAAKRFLISSRMEKADV